jgi:hypothetical protein
MLRREFLSGLAGWGVQGGIACCSVGCGTLFHSERCGRPHAGRIDWKVAAFDALGLLLFFVPGVIAFVVDFSTGAIYLPEPDQGFPEYMPTPQEPVPALPYQPPAAVSTIQTSSHLVSAATAGQPLPAWQVVQSADLKRVLVVRDDLGPQRLEQLVSSHVGRPVSLSNADARISRLPRLDRFANQCRQHRTDRNFGFPVKTFFDGLPRA